jgi:hypothetical protein
MLPFLSTAIPSTSEISVLLALTVFASAGMAETATHKKIFSVIKSLRFFLSMFKPLYERKNAMKTPFSPLKIQEK